MGMAWGLNFGVDQGVQQHTIGALGGTPLIRGEHADGATVLKTDGWSNNVVGLLKKGDKLHWDGSEAVNPSSKEPTGGSRFVTVAADVDSNGTGQADIPISPALKSTGRTGTSTSCRPTTRRCASGASTARRTRTSASRWG